MASSNNYPPEKVPVEPPDGHPAYRDQTAEAGQYLTGSDVSGYYPPSVKAPPPGYHDSEAQSRQHAPPLPPRHDPAGMPESDHKAATDFSNDDTTNPAHYTRDPHKLVAYLVPFPKPQIKGVDPATVPERFLIYTPPPPPLQKPAEGEKEGKVHKVQRKWQEEVRSAKESDAKLASWQGVKSRATKGINAAIGMTKSSNLEFLNRFPSSSSSSPSSSTPNASSSNAGTTQTASTSSGSGGPALTDLILIHPSSLPGPEARIREEFVSTMLRTKSKAQRDAIIATGLMPVAYGIDILATLIWPFGGLGEIDTVWAYSSLRGAKTARSVTKRLGGAEAAVQGPGPDNVPSKDDGKPVDIGDKLKLTFAPSERLDVLRRMLDGECHRRNRGRFAAARGGPEPTDTQALEAIGWVPSRAAANSAAAASVAPSTAEKASGEQHGGDGDDKEKNWEDEAWERREVKEDLRGVMHKGAKEWDKWCAAFEKDPQKALKR